MVVLSEYGSEVLDLSHEQAAILQRTGFFNVTAAPNARWRVTATSFVGTVNLGDLKVLVRPKINPENLFLLLEPGLPAGAWQQEAFDYEISSDLLPSVIAFFARTVETTLGRGVLRSYRSRSESLVALRGRLDLAGQFRRAGVLTPIASTFDDFTDDIAENQVLRQAIRLALRVPKIHGDDRRRLLAQLAALADVSDVPVTPAAVDGLTITRLNQHYEPALRLANLLLKNLSLRDRHGTTSASAFMVDMNDLFQRFVTERLRRELRGHLDVIDEPAQYLGRGKQVLMKPDLVFRGLAGANVYVGDVKYKLTDDATGRSSDYYQLLAYTTALDLAEGVLIYCRQSGRQAESAVTVRHAEKRLVVRGVDLTGSPDEVHEELAQLASWITQRGEGLASRTSRELDP